MGEGANLYSIEAISEALIAAGSIAAASGDAQQIIRGYMVSLQQVLHASCVVYSPSLSSPFSAIPVLEVSDGFASALPTVTPTMEEAILHAPHQTASSEDGELQRAHLSNTSAASMWSCVPAGESNFGTLGVLDEASRQFGRVEQQLLRTFALQLSYALKTLLTRKQAEANRKTGSREVHRYMEATQLIGNVSRDLINPLTAIIGYVDLLRAEPLDERCMQYLKKLHAQTEKMQDIVMAMNSAPTSRISGTEHTTEHTPEPDMLLPGMPQIVPAPTLRGKPKAAPTGRSRVLIIQKSDAVIEFEKTVLSALNAEVFAATSGAEAISLLQSQDVQAVIIGDELEGEFRGRALVEWIHEHRPDLSNKLLLTVSSAPRDEIRELIETHGVPFITKPLQILDLFAGMKQVLGFSPDATGKRFLN